MAGLPIPADKWVFWPAEADKQDFITGEVRLPLLMPAAGWVTGLAIFRADLLPVSYAPWLAVLAIIFLFWKPARWPALAMLLGIIWGTGALLWDAKQVAVDSAWLQRPVTISARIEQTQIQPGYLRLLLRQIQRSDGVSVKRAIIYAPNNNQTQGLRAGQYVKAVVKWRLPRNYGNPGAFDYRSYCFDRHIALIGSVRGDMHVLDAGHGLLEAMRGRVRRALGGLPAEQGGILRALLLADRSHIPVDVYEAFAASGAAHLLAISGLHVGMVAAWAFLLCWWLLTRREAWIVRLPVRRLSLAAGAVCACTYATMAGWPLPTQRAVMMLAAAMLAWWLRTKTSPLNALLAALTLILLWDPQAVVSISLWLSFIAASALLIWAKRLHDPGTRSLRGWLIGLVWMSVVATLATLPMITHIFSRLPSYSLPANILLIPLYSLAVLPLTLLGEMAAVIGLHETAHLMFIFAGKATSLGHAGLFAIYAWPGGKMWIPNPPIWAAWLYVAGMATAGWLLIRYKRRQAAMAAVLTLGLYLAALVPERPVDNVQLVVWDVGQGAASSLAIPGGQIMVIDVPGSRGSRYNGGTHVAAGLRRLGHAHVDVLVLTHAQQDHMGGAMRLLDQIRHVRELWLADVPYNRSHAGMQQVIRRVTEAGGSIRWLKRGDRLMLENLSARVLWPPKGWRHSNHNNASLVMSLQTPGGARLLFCGDIEAVAESAILVDGPKPHHIALMPHHGSRTSSSAAWVKAISPQHVIAQTGFGNRYGFPRPVVIDRYLDVGATVWNTANGALLLRLDNTSAGHVNIRQYQPLAAGNRERALQWWQGHL